ncbi:MAG: TspO/MBR family protein [Balneolaceae bacterium]
MTPEIETPSFRSRSSLISLGLFLLLVTGVALFASMFEPGTWYEALEKPAWTPPDWLFAPTWGVLYILIAMAGWRVWVLDTNPGWNQAVQLWFLQLGLNAVWSWIFFGFHRTGFGLFVILVLWLSIAWFILKSGDWVSSLLFLPYLAWISFALSLNGAIFWLN